jgi:hypothetical protein
MYIQSTSGSWLSPHQERQWLSRRGVRRRIGQSLVRVGICYCRHASNAFNSGDNPCRPPEAGNAEGSSTAQRLWGDTRPEQGQS